MTGASDSLVHGIQERLSGQQHYARFPDPDGNKDVEGHKARKRSKLLTVAPFILSAHCYRALMLFLLLQYTDSDEDQCIRCAGSELCERLAYYRSARPVASALCRRWRLAVCGKRVFRS